MGLDVSLYHCTNIKKFEELEKIEETLRDAVWESIPGDWKDWTDEQKDSCNQQCADISRATTDKLIVDDALLTPICEDSKLDPEHIFKLGYFRSSYNDGGINSHLFDRGFNTLYDIFPNCENDGYYIEADWENALKETQSIIKAYGDYLENDPTAKVYASVEYFRLPSLSREEELNRSEGLSRKRAMDVYREKLKEIKESPWLSTHCQAFSDKIGVWFPNGLKLYGILLFSNGIVYIHDGGGVIEGKEDFYLTALKIVEETIQFVLDQEDPQHYYLGWSG